MSYFIDIHCHPVVKFYLFGGERHHSLFIDSQGRPDINYTNNQVTVKAMTKAKMNAVFAAHLLPDVLPLLQRRPVQFRALERAAGRRLRLPRLPRNGTELNPAGWHRASSRC